MSFYGCKISKNKSQSNEPISQMDIVSKPYPSTNFIGSVMDLKSNKPIPFVNVVLTDKMGNYNKTVTDENGNFDIKNLPLGVYQLQISANDYQGIEKTFNIKSHTNYQLKIKLAEHIIVEEKPVIYLYPTVKQDVQVILNYKGVLKHTYPKYSNQGWTVTAEPNGTLWDKNGQEYYALFWEGTPYQLIIPQDGFVVSGKESAAFLEEKLAYLGLNRREANEFIMYWLPRLEGNPYNLIHFAGEQYLEQAELIITPKPESMIRVMMLTQPLNSKLNFPLQDLSSLKKIRKGFTIVEWGGSVIGTIKEKI